MSGLPMRDESRCEQDPNGHPLSVAWPCKEGEDRMTVSIGYVSDEDSGEALEIQRALKVDDQDVALGTDTYCLVRGGLSHYGGVSGWELRDETLKLSLDPQAAHTLHLPQEIEIPLSTEGARLIEDRLEGLLAITQSGES